MGILWLSNEDSFEGLDSNHNDIVDALMVSCWSGDWDHDEVLREAIQTTLGLSGFGTVLAAKCSAETDERMATTTSAVRHCAKECKTTMVALANWETIVPGALRAAVKSCIVACEETYADFQRYRPKLYPGLGAHRHELYDTVHLMRKTMSVVLDCIVACEEFLKVWGRGTRIVTSS
jgi:hypothetical protein